MCACVFVHVFFPHCHMPDYSCHDASHRDQSKAKRKHKSNINCTNKWHWQLTAAATPAALHLQLADLNSVGNSQIFSGRLSVFACLPFMAVTDFGFDFVSTTLFTGFFLLFFLTAAHAKHANLFILLWALNWNANSEMTSCPPPKHKLNSYSEGHFLPNYCWLMYTGGLLFGGSFFFFLICLQHGLSLSRRTICLHNDKLDNWSKRKEVKKLTFGC